MFKRTPNGLSNNHLFYNVDFTVYCEGKSQSHEASTFDELFWSVILKKFGLSFIIKSMGNKSSVLNILEDIEVNGVKNVLLCADSDYDDVFSSKIDHPCLIYSMGYSWESDAVFCMNFFSSINLFINCANDQVYLADFQRFISNFETSLRRMCMIDIRYFNAPLPLFDRDKPQSILINNFANPPKINTKKVLKSASGISYSTPEGLTYPTNPWLAFFGKSTAKIVYHWFAYRFCKDKQARNVPFETFMGHLASTCALNDNDISDHYGSKVARFVDYNATQ